MDAAVKDLEYVQPLTGEEIVIDACSRLAKALRADCNLRDSDAYSGGYYAKISIHLECYGMDTAQVDTTVTGGKQKPNPDKAADVEINIPLEPELNLVRERSEQPVPTLTTGEEGEPVVKQRRYVRAADKTA